MRNRPFYQTGFGAKLTSLLYWIWCEIYLFTLLNLVRNRPKFGAKSTFLPFWIWCEINLNLVPNRHTIWKLTEFLRGENGFWSRQRAQQFLLCPWVGKNTILHQKVTISHQISRTKLLRFRTKFHYDFAPKNYDFAPNLPDQIIMISHQIYNDFAPNLLRFRTKFNMILHKLPSNFPLFWVRLGKSWAPSGRESSPQGLDMDFEWNYI